MSKTRRIKEYLRQLVVRELNEQGDEKKKRPWHTPAHFGGGENINVFGYKTENFDICKSAVVLFQKLEKVLNAQSENQEAFQQHKKQVVMAAEFIDKLLGIEKEVVEKKSTSSEQLDAALELLYFFTYKIGVVGGRLEMDLSKELSFVKEHYQQIQKRYKSSVEESSTTASAGIDGTGTGHYDSPFAFSGKGKKNRRKKIAKQSGYNPVNEVTGQEFVAINKIVTNLNNIQKSYQRATGIGDKELKDRKYNKHYETILAAKKSMISLLNILKTKQMLGEGSMDWEKDFKWANEKELKVIAKLVHMNNGIAPVIKMSKKPDFKSFIKRAAQKGLGESINEGRYHTWRNDESLTAKQKIGRSIREVRNSLTELDKTVKMAVKLKTELNMKSEDYWKNTHKALTKISERLVKMANKVGNLK